MSLSAEARVIQETPEEFAARLERLGGRAFIVTDPATGELRASHEALAPVVQFLADERRDFDAHEGLFFERARQSGALLVAVIHSTRRGASQGGLRRWSYLTTAALIRDGLRLARGMTRKNALAGLWWGGGKGIIARDQRVLDPAERARVYREYGQFVTSLRGCYVTAEDAGTRAEDMAQVFATTRFTTCIPPAVGGSGNPSPATALGVVRAMEGALAHRGRGLAGARVVMQGCGNVATAMIGDLLAHGVASITASEISRERVAHVRDRFAGAPVEIHEVAPGDDRVLALPCDILAPNALGGVLNPETIPTIRADIVCGAANNQLLDEARDGAALRARGILYVPDFLCNRMGIVHCANEQYGYVPDDPAIARHLGRDWENSVFQATRRVLARAEREGITTAEAANRTADELATHEHPIWGHRGQAIIRGLMADRWHERRDA